MRRFRFRLQKVLDFRETVEEQAKSTFLEARARRLDAEAQIAAIDRRRRQALETDCERIDQMIALEAFLARLDDEQRAQEAVVSILLQDEQRAYDDWRLREQEAEALRKLKQKELDEHALAMQRSEQKELDEMALRRKEVA